MKKTYFTTVFLFACTLFAAAQNSSSLNPTVQVTNAYVGRLLQADRPQQEPVVPDSLRHFDLDFDYTGFENPYRGNSEFNPYFTDLELAPTVLSTKRFYLKAGAGFTMHPELDFAWTVKQKGGFKMGVYALGNAYWGQYATVDNLSGSSLLPGSSDYSGYEGRAKAGIDARADWKKAQMLLNVNWDGVASKGQHWSSACRLLYNDVKADLKLFSNTGADAVTYWGAKLSFVHGKDAFRSTYTCNTRENSAALDAFLGFNFNGGGSLEVGVEGNWANMTGESSLWGGDVVLTPRYYFATGQRLDLYAGLCVMLGFGDALYKPSNIGFFPSFGLSFKAVPDRLDIYLDTSMKGGVDNLRSLNLKYGYYADGRTLAMLRDMNAQFGLKGNLAGKLRYDLSFGFDRTENASNLYVGMTDGGSPDSYCLSVLYGNVSKVYGNLSMEGRFGSFHFDLDARYDSYIDTPAKGVTPPALHLGCNLGYDVLDRIGINAGISYASEYKCSETYSTPSWADLHAGLKFKMTRSLGLYLDGHNLLGQSMQIAPLHVQKGIYLTGGIVLNF